MDNQEEVALNCERCGQPGGISRTLIAEGSTDHFDMTACNPCWAYYESTYTMNPAVTDAEIDQFLQREGYQG